MTNEQREVMKCLADRKEMDLIEVIRTFKREGIENFAVVRKEYLDTALSLIKEQEEKIEKLKNKEVLIKRYFKKCDLIKQKDKQIDLMAKYWNAGLAKCDNCDKIVEKYKKNKCQECIKQYFAGLVEKE